MMNRRSILMSLNVFSIFKFYFDWTDIIYYKRKINSDGVYVVKKETREEDFVQV